MADGRNGLNIVRLLLALAVIVSHAWPLGYGDDDPHVGSVTLGTVAVYGFFGISGYLIAQSRERVGGGRRYFRHRALRILPGYWVMLLLVATLFAPLAWARTHDGVGGYPVGGAVAWVGLYAMPFILDIAIKGTLTSARADLQTWNGQTWSLFYELLCYAMLASLAKRGLLKTQPVAVALASLTVAMATWNLPGVADAAGFANLPLQRLTATTAMFAAGTLLYTVRDRVVVSGRWAAASFVTIVVVLLALPMPQALLPLPLAYLMLWAGAASGGVTWFRRNDLSYGTYLYGFAVAQLLTAYGVNDRGMPTYLSTTAVVSLLLAWVSWIGVERPALNRKDRPSKVAEPSIVA